MRIWIDCEWSGDDLISMGMVAENGREWYGILHCFDPEPWVKENVIPVLGGSEIGTWSDKRTFQIAMQEYLLKFDACHIIADWPEDIAWFCRMLVTGPGKRIGTPPLTLEIDRSLDSKGSRIPHNALEDAKAIRRMALNEAQ